MNKYLDKYFQDLPGSVLGMILWCMWIICVLLIYSVGSWLNPENYKDIVYALEVILVYFPSFHLSNFYYKFRKRQIEWLKSNGTKISANFIGVESRLWSFLYELRANMNDRRVYVEGEYNGVTRKFKSEVFNFGYKKSFFGFEQKDKAIAIIKTKGENFNVYISPQNPQVYWVDTDFLK